MRKHAGKGNRNGTHPQESSQIMSSHRHLTKAPYGNIEVLHPNGFVMFRTGDSRANWYLKRGLATSVSARVIQLTFEPNGPGHCDEPFFTCEKANACVVCGKSNDLTRHHVVPACYKIHFPKITDRVGSYDVLPLCDKDHEKYNLQQRDLMQVIADTYEAPVSGRTLNAEQVKDHRQFRSHAITLLAHGDKMPPHRRELLSKGVISYFGHDRLQEIVDLPIPESTVITHGQLVMQKVTELDNFAIMWRNHFVESMSPAHLPSFWIPEKKIYDLPDSAT